MGVGSEVGLRARGSRTSLTTKCAAVDEFLMSDGSDDNVIANSDQSRGRTFSCSNIIDLPGGWRQGPAHRPAGGGVRGPRRGGQPGGAGAAAGVHVCGHRRASQSEK